MENNICIKKARIAILIFAILALSFSLTCVFSMPVHASSSSSKTLLKDVRKAPVKKGKWVKKGTNWKYQYSNKKYAKSTWLKVNGKFYYMKDDTYMATGWLTYNKKKYYLNKNGDMAVGWVQYKKKWYYLNKNGTMASTQWITYNGKKYYLGKNGIMTSGWSTINKKKYYFNSNGDLNTGWTKVKSTWYYLKSDGSLASYQKSSQMIFVKASGYTAELTMLERRTKNTWKEILRTSAYVGRLGVGDKAGEGIAVTPSGTYSFGVAFGNRTSPGTVFPYTKVNASHYWVDDPGSRFYNKFVSTKNVQKDWNSAEHLSDYPTAYAYALSINYNTSCVPGAGSAIFLHCNGGGPTAGCIAVPERDMIFILQHIKKDALININRK